MTNELQRLMQQFEVSTLDQLMNLGVGDIQSRVAHQFGLQPEQLPQGAFCQITPDIIKGIYQKQYSPLLWSQGQTMMDEFTRDYTKTLNPLYGGFSGTGYQQKYMQHGARDVFGQKMLPMITQIQKQRREGMAGLTGTLQSFLDVGRDYSVPDTSIT